MYREKGQYVGDKLVQLRDRLRRNLRLSLSLTRSLTLTPN
jgi:hypothetical protein